MQEKYKHREKSVSNHLPAHFNVNLYEDLKKKGSERPGGNRVELMKGEKNPRRLLCLLLPKSLLQAQRLIDTRMPAPTPRGAKGHGRSLLPALDLIKVCLVKGCPGFFWLTVCLPWEWIPEDLPASRAFLQRQLSRDPALPSSEPRRENWNG